MTGRRDEWQAFENDCFDDTPFSFRLGANQTVIPEFLSPLTSRMTSLHQEGH